MDNLKLDLSKYHYKTRSQNPTKVSCGENELDSLLFQEIGLSYKSYQFLKAMAETGTAITEVPRIEVFRQLVASALLTQITDVEIAFLSILLKRFGWRDFVEEPKLTLIFSAYASKGTLNESTSKLDSLLSAKIPNFEEKYRSWYSKKVGLVNLNYIELNLEYTELGKTEVIFDEEQKVDYNELVDELVENTLRNEHHNRSRLSSENTEDTESMKLKRSKHK